MGKNQPLIDVHGLAHQSIRSVSSRALLARHPNLTLPSLECKLRSNPSLIILASTRGKPPRYPLDILPRFRRNERSLVVRRQQQCFWSRASPVSLQLGTRRHSAQPFGIRQEGRRGQQRRRRYFGKSRMSSFDSDDEGESLQEKNVGESLWKSAVDPNSGRTYYYHSITRETQWRKPVELATPEERRATEEKELQQRDFFAAMEANILNSISAGAFNVASTSDVSSAAPRDASPTREISPVQKEISLPGNSSKSRNEAKAATQSFAGLRGGRAPPPVTVRPNLIRTISSMEDTLLIDLITRVPSHRSIWDSRQQQQQEQQPPVIQAASSAEEHNKDIVFQPPGSESEKDLEGKKKKSGKNRSSESTVEKTFLRLKEPIGYRQALLESTGMSARSSLNSIDERVQASQGSMLRGLSFNSQSHSSEDYKWDDNSSTYGVSGRTYGITPTEVVPDEQSIVVPGNSTRTLDGNTTLGDSSNLSFGLTAEEQLALEELAKVTDEMASILDDDAMPADLMSTTSSMYLANIAEDGDEEGDEDHGDDDEKDDEVAGAVSCIDQEYNVIDPRSGLRMSPQTKTWDILASRDISLNQALYKSALPAVPQQSPVTPKVGGFQPPLPLFSGSTVSGAASSSNENVNEIRIETGRPDSSTAPPPEQAPIDKREEVEVAPATGTDKNLGNQERSSSQRSLSTTNVKRRTIKRRNTCGTLVRACLVFN